MRELKAKKSLGQHFLRSQKALEQIVSTLPESTNEIVFEIGPGEGVLTERILSKGYAVAVVEIDKRSIELLQEKFQSEIKNKKLFIIESDCLEVDYKKQIEAINKKAKTNFSKYFLLGNIPYYITGAIFRSSFEQKLLPTDITFLVQKEVAQRIVSRDKKESILSVSVKIFSDNVKIVDIVKAGSFSPPPKVDSAIISIANIKDVFGSIKKQEIFFQILRAGFSHKRKYILSNLKTDLDEKVFTKHFEKLKMYFKEKDRAEDIYMDVWKKIIKSI
jgi:16S rRNA (adenine1518-N6/adenine1519-N6)-dimethyltransferase